MAYKILYLEDLNPETKVAELSNYGYDVAPPAGTIIAESAGRVTPSYSCAST